MKKLSLSIIFAVLSLCSLANIISVNNSSVSEFKRFQADFSILKERKGLEDPIKFSPVKKTAFDNFNELEGEQSWIRLNMLDRYATGLMYGPINISITDKDKGEIELILPGLADRGLGGIKAQVDFQAGTMSIPNNQLLGVDRLGDDIYFYIKEVSEDGKDTVSRPEDYLSVGEISESGIYFFDYDLWAIADPENEKAGFYYLTCFNRITPVIDPNAGWEPFCNGTFIDGWMIPSLGLNPADYPYEVVIQKFEESDSKFRIYNPYSCETFPFRDKFDAGEGSIEFDIENPNFVYVSSEVYSGVSYDFGAAAPVAIFCTNAAGYYIGLGYTYEDIIAQIGNNGPKWSTYSNGNVYFNDCYFMVPSSNNLLVWDDAAAELMHGALYFEIDPVTGEPNSLEEPVSDQTPTEYFNLQGIRVSPETKGLLIQRRGDKFTKKISR